MSEQKEKFFPEGFIYKQPHERAPEFVKGSASIKVNEFIAYLQKVQADWLNLDFKVSKSGKAYAEVNTFKPDKSKAKKEEPEPQQPEITDDGDDSLPF